MATELCCICGKECQPHWMIHRGKKAYCDDTECLEKIPKEHVKSYH